MQWIIKRYQISSSGTVLDIKTLVGIDWSGTPSWVSKNCRIIQPMTLRDKHWAMACFRQCKRGLSKNTEGARFEIMLEAT